MTERIDHAAIAERLLESAKSDPALTVELATVAQARATLALVEQQRIANLIALGSIDIYGTAPFRHLIAEPVDEYGIEPTAMVREGLGL